MKIMLLFLSNLIQWEVSFQLIGPALSGGAWWIPCTPNYAEELCSKVEHWTFLFLLLLMSEIDYKQTKS